MSFKSLGISAISALALALPVWAHHSHGYYGKEFIDMAGVVTEVHLINPHSWIYMEVTDDKGQKTEWALEAHTPRALERIGITSAYIGTGDNIKVRCHPLRDGGSDCLLGFVQAGDGSIKDWDANGAMPVDDGFFDIP
ncbi:MAG: hypothetical protein E2O65_05575 [Gammaproteobacteria bacterium]|nr:MAG: hypothetical protein E2O65_05575 [Gammaproteobacteria bacterium]